MSRLFAPHSFSPPFFIFLRRPVPLSLSCPSNLSTPSDKPPKSPGNTHLSHATSTRSRMRSPGPIVTPSMQNATYLAMQPSALMYPHNTLEWPMKPSGYLFDPLDRRRDPDLGLIAPPHALRPRGAQPVGPLQLHLFALRLILLRAPVEAPHDLVHQQRVVRVLQRDRLPTFWLVYP
eukprot:1084854-Rhodomonas_salina.2